MTVGITTAQWRSARHSSGILKSIMKAVRGVQRRGGSLFFIVAGIYFFAFSAPAALAAPSPYFIPARTSGVAPLAVFFDTASSTSASTTDTGVTDRPFHDLDYAWDFGDPTAGNWTYGTASSSKNLAYGPEAAHVFETPGTYTVTLTVNNGTDSAATSTTITVTDPDIVFSGTNTVCFFNNTVGTGCPSGATETASSDFDAALAACAGANKRCLFKRDDSFPVSAVTTLSNTYTGMSIGAYGSGAKPLVTATVALEPIIWVPNNIAADIRIMDIEFDGEQTQALSSVVQMQFANPTLTGQVLVSNLTISGSRVPLYSVGNGVQGSDWFFVGNTINAYGPGSGSPTVGYGMYLAAYKLAIMGNSVTQPSNSGSHLMRIDEVRKGVISNNTYGYIGGSQHHIKVESAPLGTNQLIISDNVYTQASPYSVLLTAQADDNESIQDVIIERNYHHTQSATGQWAYAIDNGVGVTIRNNIVDGSNGGNTNGLLTVFQSIYPSTPPPNNIWIYNNTYYSSKAIPASQVAVICPGTGLTNLVGKNLLMYVPNATSGTGAVVRSDCTGSITTANNTTNSKTNPSFASTTPSYSLTDDFKLGVGSYAIGTTTSRILGVLRDFGNTLRPSTPSIGAFDLNAPSLTVADASSVEQTAATLNGTLSITGGAGSTVRGFAYGTSVSMGGDTATTTDTTGQPFSTGAFTASLASLLCNTAYYARPYAANSVGPGFGATTTFTTSACSSGGGGPRDATLTLTLAILNDEGGTLSPSDVSLFVNDTPVSSGIPHAFSAPAPAYTVSGTSVSGYTQSFSGSCDEDGRIALGGGDAKACTLTYDDSAPPASSSSAPSVSAPAPSVSAPALPPTPSSRLSPGQIASILNVLASFGADASVISRVQAALQGAPSPLADSGLPSASTPPSPSFSRDLETGMEGEDVRALQRFLNQQGFTIAPAGLDSTGSPRAGSPGNETTRFGALTRAALIRFQEAHGITPAAGYLGVKTRGVVERLRED